jgi:hypothetical protein
MSSSFSLHLSKHKDQWSFTIVRPDATAMSGVRDSLAECYTELEEHISAWESHEDFASNASCDCEGSFHYCNSI